MKEEKEFLEVVVADIMTENVEVVNKNMLVSQVAHLMLRERVSGYPVVNDDESIAGIVTLTDLFIFLDKITAEMEFDNKEGRQVSFHNKIVQYKEMPVYKIMSENMISIPSSMSLSELINIVIEKKIHSFPVVEDGKLVGIVGRHDILNAAFLYG